MERALDDVRPGKLSGKGSPRGAGVLIASAGRINECDAVAGGVGISFMRLDGLRSRIVPRGLLLRNMLIWGGDEERSCRPIAEASGEAWITRDMCDDANSSCERNDEVQGCLLLDEVLVA